MKRFFSVVLSILILSTSFSAFATVAKAETVISSTSPAITADVGETVNLSS